LKGLEIGVKILSYIANSPLSFEGERINRAVIREY